MRTSLFSLFLLVACVPMQVDPASSAAASAESQAVAISEALEVLESIQALQAEGDFPGVLTHTSADIRLVGTDASEHWDRAKLEGVVKAMEAQEFVWKVRVTNRVLTAGPSADVVWFEEKIMTVTPAVGELRRSGVLVLEEGAWKLVQSVTSFPIPNDQVPALLGILGLNPEVALPIVAEEVDPPAAETVPEAEESRVEEPDIEAVEEEESDAGE